MRVISFLEKRRKRLNSKGFSSIVGAIFMMLIAMSLATAYFVSTLAQNTNYNLAIRQQNQLELDRLNEQITASSATYSVLGNLVTVEVVISNTGNIPVTLKSLWVLDNSTGYFGVLNTTILVPAKNTVVRSQSTGNAFNVTTNGPMNTGAISSWFVTARGNIVRLVWTEGSLSYDAIYGPV